MQPRTMHTKRTRSGSIALEALLILPLLLLVISASVEFGMILYAEQRLAEAAGRASRVAATGGTRADIDAVLLAILGQKLASAATVITNDCPECPGPNCDPGSRALESGELLIVRIEVPSQAAAPNVLGMIGISLYGQKLIGQSVVLKE